MTKNEFIQLCNSYCIAPEIALEKQSIKSILLNNNRPLINRSSIASAMLIEEILINEF